MTVRSYSFIVLVVVVSAFIVWLIARNVRPVNRPRPLSSTSNGVDTAHLPSIETSIVDINYVEKSPPTKTPTIEIHGENPPSNKSAKVFSGRNYVTSMDFWEQLSQGSRSLAYLQRIASALQVPDMTVVEPFMGETNTQCLDFYFKNVSASDIRFEDCYDFKEWSSASTQYGLAPIISLEEFIIEAQSYNKFVVFVQVPYEGRMREDIIQDCKIPGWKLASNYSIGQTIDDGLYSRFTVVKKMCINPARTLSMDTVRRAIFDGLETKDVFVVFTLWRGPTHLHWNINIDAAQTQAFLSQHRKVSPIVVANAEKYIKRFGLLDSNQYIAIMGRFEKPVGEGFRVGGAEHRKQLIEQRIAETLIKLSEVKEETGIDRVFLGFDYGKYGSETFYHHNFYGAGEALEQLQSTIHKDLSYSEWEDTFRNVTVPVTGQGPVALLQVTLAARSRCVILVGYGNFLHYVKDQHMKYHQSTGTQFCFQCVPPHVNCGM